MRVSMRFATSIFSFIFVLVTAMSAVAQENNYGKASKKSHVNSYLKKKAAPAKARIVGKAVNRKTVKSKKVAKVNKKNLQKAHQKKIVAKMKIKSHKKAQRHVASEKKKAKIVKKDTKKKNKKSKKNINQ